MFKNFIPLASFNNWQSSWIMRVAESSYGKPLTGHKRNLFYSIFSGVFAGFILAASVLCFSIFLFNHNFTSELLLVFGAVFLKVTIFVFLVSMLLTEADDIKRIVKKNRKHEFLLSVLINSGAFIVVFILSLVFYSYYFTPSKYFSEIELSSQGCPNGKCEVSTIQPDLNISNVEETSENKLPKVEEEKEKNELGDGISFDAFQ